MSIRREALPSNAVANREPLPGSRKVYVAGPHGMRVPFREIALAPTRGDARRRRDERADARLRHVGALHGPGGRDRPLPRACRSCAARGSWLAARTTARAACASSAPGLGDGACRAEVLRGRGNVTQMHYARSGDITPEMEFVAIREGLPRRARARRGRARARDHPGQHQPPRARADDHRPQVPREDQRQHRQLGGRLLDRGGGREDALGDALGRRHRDGPLDRARTSTRPASGSCATRRCRSGRCRSTRRSRRSAARPRS